MIKVNGRSSSWEQGMTVTKLLTLKKFVYPRISILINSQWVAEEDFTHTEINPGDDIQVIHMMAGG